MQSELISAAADRWNGSPDIRDTRALDDRDQDCLNAIRDVLKQHGCLDRFGVTLVHRHFEMAPDELLVEQVDEAGRRLVTKPVRLDVVRDQLPGAYETQWQWKDDGAGHVAQICVSRCFPGNPSSPGHASQHVGW